MAKSQPLIPPIGKKVQLADYDPDYTAEYKHGKDVADQLTKDSDRLRDLQDQLYADNKHALLVVLQAIDTGGKDGTIKHVFEGVNPQGVEVTSFKQPSLAEAAHDFLWRIHQSVPAKGRIGVFNRSHYEQVLVVRVHNLVPKTEWEHAYDQINQFEALLAGTGTTILKFFLHISKDEQKKRFEDRLHDPDKQWKFSLADIEERKRWDDYTAAFEDMLTRCNTEQAPWHIVPANHKWYRDLMVTQTIIEALKGMKLTYPAPIANVEQIVVPD